MKLRIGILTAPHVEVQRNEDGTFRLQNVHIGIDFHWSRFEDQVFEGEMEIRTNPDGTQTAINTIDLEDYLSSVISSEMAAEAPMELLKAHAIISRSFIVRLIERERNRRASASTLRQRNYEDGGHVGFDVCADDHCQRYEGILRRNSRAVEAVQATCGQVLTYDGEICDTRFSKCCGGKSEEFETCWEDLHFRYLESVECPFCGRAAATVGQPDSPLRYSLLNYDQETTCFHDWEVRYTHAQLDDLVSRKSGIHFGHISALTPLRRGKSGRIYELEIQGSLTTQVIGKELKIRKALSETCLYSSWFDVEKTDTEWIFRGHGWGHGVGMCQIGATQMAAEGYTHQQILTHYFRGAEIQDLDSLTLCNLSI